MSSTFKDFSVERDLLQAKLFPRMKALAASRGGDLRIVDLRWGIPREASRLHTPPHICLQEVEHALSTEIEPRLLCLIGQRYGWRPLPLWIDDTHLQGLQRLATQGDAVVTPDTLGLIRRWYIRDENAQPAHYALQRVEPSSRDEWRNAEGVLRGALDRLGPLDAWLEDHARSLTEREARHAFNGGAKAFALVRTINDLATASAADLNDLSETDAALIARQDALRTYVRGAVAPAQLADLSTSAAAALNRSTDKTYEAALVTAIETWMSGEITSAIDGFEKLRSTSSQTDTQRRLAKRSADEFVVRTDELTRLTSAARAEGQGVIVVHGAAGSGKTTLLSRLWEDLDDGRRQVVARFLHTSAGAGPRQIMDGLLEELQLVAGGHTALPSMESAAVDLFRQTLTQIGAHQDCAILIDGADEVPEFAETLARWLGGAGSSRIKIIIGVRDGPANDVLARDLPRAQHIPLAPLSRSDGAALLDTWLSAIGRRLQATQRDAVLDAFLGSASPLWMRIAIETVRSWSSATAPVSLPDSLERLLRDCFLAVALDPLEHEPSFSLRALSLIAASRQGLTENELLDCVSADAEFWKDFNANPSWRLPELRVPDAVWGRLKFLLSPYLTEAGSPGDGLLRFRHAIFNEAMRDAWRGKMRNPHDMLREHFAAQALHHKGRGAAPATANRRKLTELPFQLAACGATGDLTTLVTDGDWRLAWIDAEGFDRSFLADLDLALDALGSEFDGDAFECAVRLMLARWRSDPFRLSSEESDLRLMAWAGFEDRAIALASEHTSDEDAASAFSVIAEAITARSKGADTRLLLRAEKAASGLANPWKAIRSLERLGRAFARLDDTEAAERLIGRLAGVQAKTIGEDETRSRIVSGMGEEFADHGKFDLARKAVELMDYGMIFDGRIHVQSAIARNLAERGRLDEAIALADSFTESVYDYENVWTGLLRGAHQRGRDTLLAALTKIDLARVETGSLFEMAHYIGDDEDVLRILLGRILQEAASIVPELAALNRSIAAATAAEEAALPKEERVRFRFDLKFSPREFTAEQKRAEKLRMETGRLDIGHLPRWAAMLREPYCGDLFEVVVDLRSHVGGPRGERARASLAAGLSISGRTEDGRRELMSTLRWVLSPGYAFEGRQDDAARIYPLAQLISICIPDAATLNAIVSELEAPRERLMIALATIYTRQFVASEIVESARQTVIAVLSEIDAIPLLRVASDIVTQDGDAQLSALVLQRLEHQLQQRIEDAAPSYYAFDLAHEGYPLVDPAAALDAALAGRLGKPECAVPGIAKALAAHPAAKSLPVLKDAARWICSERVSYSGAAQVIGALVKAGEIALAAELLANELSQDDAASHTLIVDAVVAFASAGHAPEFIEAVTGKGAQFTYDLVWLVSLAKETPEARATATLDPDHFERIYHPSHHDALIATAHGARLLGMPAGGQLYDKVIERVLAETNENDYGLDPRNGHLTDLVFAFCRLGELDYAERVLGHVRGHGGDGQNRIDLARSRGAFGEACIRGGELERGRQMLVHLNGFDKDERIAAGEIRIAVVGALLRAGQHAEAEREAQNIGDALQRRRALALLAVDHCAHVRVQRGLRLIQQTELNNRIHCLMECMNAWVRSGARVTARKYEEIAVALAV